MKFVYLSFTWASTVILAVAMNIEMVVRCATSKIIIPYLFTNSIPNVEIDIRLYETNTISTHSLVFSI